MQPAAGFLGLRQSRGGLQRQRVGMAAIRHALTLNLQFPFGLERVHGKGNGVQAALSGFGQPSDGGCGWLKGLWN